MAEHKSLAEALAALQSELPRVKKDNTAKVEPEGKKAFSYRYADLATVSAALMPLLGKHGLSFSAKPTLEDGRLVLAYVLRHVSGDSDSGSYPIQGNTPQQVGSAISYGRRYALCAMTGVAPDEDDDDAAAVARERMDDWEAARVPTEAQIAAAEKFSTEILEAVDPQSVMEMGAKVQAAVAAGEITKPQRDRLSRQAAARLAHLKRAAEAIPEQGAEGLTPAEQHDLDKAEDATWK